MESRLFIKAAASVMERMRFSSIGSSSFEEEQEKKAAIQKDLNHLLFTLQNPTLPSAERLVNVALDYNFQVDNRILSKIRQAESYWQG